MSSYTTFLTSLQPGDCIKLKNIDYTYIVLDIIYKDGKSYEVLAVRDRLLEGDSRIQSFKSGWGLSRIAEAEFIENEKKYDTIRA